VISSAPVKTGAERNARRHYAWVIVAVTFTAMLIGAGIRYTSGVLIGPLETEFGWDRASISLSVSIGLLLFGLSGPMAGALLDRFGPRRVMTVGMGMTVLGVGLMVFMRELWQLYLLWGVMTGLGTGALAGSLGAVIATRWFKARRGMVIGLFSSATSMGQLVFIPLLMGVTVAAGWRSAVVVLAIVGAAVALPIGLLMRNNPSDKGLLPFGDSGAVGTASQRLEETRSTTVREAIRGREFWLLAFNLFICGYTTTGLVTTHFISASLEHGFDETMTAGAMGVMGAMNIAGTLTAGWLTDRYDNRRLLAGCYALRGLSLVALPFILEAPQLLFFAVIYGLDWISTAPPSINLTATIYGKASLGTVYGWIFFSHMLGASVAAYVAGYLHGLLGSYNLVFISAAMMLFMAVPASLIIRIPARKKEMALA